jgi:hypothetical protein
VAAAAGGVEHAPPDASPRALVEHALGEVRDVEDEPDEVRPERGHDRRDERVRRRGRRERGEVRERRERGEGEHEEERDAVQLPCVRQRVPLAPGWEAVTLYLRWLNLSACQRESTPAQCMRTIP